MRIRMVSAQFKENKTMPEVLDTELAEEMTMKSLPLLILVLLVLAFVASPVLAGKMQPGERSAKHVHELKSVKYAGSLLSSIFGKKAIDVSVDGKKVATIPEGSKFQDVRIW